MTKHVGAIESKRPQRILIINSDGEHRTIEANKGAESVIISTIETLRTCFPRAEFMTTIQLSERLSRDLNCKVIKNKIYTTTTYSLLSSLKSFIDLVRCVIWREVRKCAKFNLKILINNKKLREYSSADVIIHLGMDLYSDDFGSRTIIEHSKDILLGVILGKPVVMWAESIGPFKSSITRYLAKFTLNRVSLITVREEISKGHLDKVGVNKPPIYITADPAFLTDPAPENYVQMILEKEGLSDSKRPLIGMCLTYLPSRVVRKSRKFTFMELIYRKLQYILPEGLFKVILRAASQTRFYSTAGIKQNIYINVMAQVADYLVERLNATVVLMPHLQGIGLLVTDRAIHEEVWHQTKHKDKIRLVAYEYTAQEIKGIIGQCELFIGGKMHSNIAALSQCIPTVGLAYSYKFRGIMEMLGQQNYVCSNIIFDEVISKVIDAWNRREEIKTDLESRLKDVRALSTLNARLVKDFVDSR
jgi:colanic acid/amylovoran biosynthesis protein